jgi:hypothetical protein
MLFEASNQYRPPLRITAGGRSQSAPVTVWMPYRHRVTTTAAEEFLRSFHAQHPGVTSNCLARGRLPDGRSTYEALATP